MQNRTGQDEPRALPPVDRNGVSLACIPSHGISNDSRLRDERDPREQKDNDDRDEVNLCQGPDLVRVGARVSAVRVPDGVGVVDACC